MEAKTSRFEILVREYLAYYLWQFEPTYNERPSFLKNESTQKNFELDIWYKSLGLAVEVNGIGHKVAKIRRRDLWKSRRCRDQGIRLFSVTNIHQLSHDKLSTELKAHLYQKGLSELARTITPYPPSKKKELSEYKPSKTAFGNLHSRVKRQLKLENAYDAQAQETKSLMRRMKIKHGNEYKIVDGKILLSEFA
ncbi:MAG TPA: hypothetical protein VHZ25_08735 [Acidobacteriaceae bacterium]|jgi:hypothetical protein|nr:hypothetical protein [Acidobacteriaceae bacterium]